jgi:membrane-associated phospholipid phosphatase
MLGRHYPTDVLAGSVLGVDITLLGIVLLDPSAPASKPQQWSRTEAAPAAHRKPGLRERKK